MKIVSVVARYLLGFIFLVFGLNGFFHFIPTPPPVGLAAQYMGALFVSHYLGVIFLAQVIPGALLLINRYVPFALAILAPVIVNIFSFHVFMMPSGLWHALVVTILWLLTYFNVRSAFTALLQPQVRGQHA